MTITSQYSPYQIQLRSHETIGTYDCDNERHAGVTQDFVIDNNKSDKYQEEVLLL